MLGLLAASRAHTAEEATAAMRGLGTLLTLVAGMASALWGHQSASLSKQAAERGRTNSQAQTDATLLSGAAATATGLALIGSVFSNLSWGSAEAALAGFSFVSLLSMSGNEIWTATALSLRQGLRPRAVLALFVLVLASILFMLRRLVAWEALF